jgi:hypothetical protein
MLFHFHAGQSLLAMVVVVFIAPLLQLLLITLFRVAEVECIPGNLETGSKMPYDYALRELSRSNAACLNKIFFSRTRFAFVDQIEDPRSDIQQF